MVYDADARTSVARPRRRSQYRERNDALRRLPSEFGSRGTWKEASTVEQVKNKCGHGCYVSPGDTLSWGCQQCYPTGHPDATATPVLPRSSGDTLGRENGERATCIACGCLRTYFTANCRNCGVQFPDDDACGHGQTTANRRQTGECPKCGSAVHYETDKISIWCCADCGEKYRAPKLMRIK